MTKTYLLRVSSGPPFPLLYRRLRRLFYKSTFILYFNQSIAFSDLYGSDFTLMTLFFCCIGLIALVSVLTVLALILLSRLRREQQRRVQLHQQVCRQQHRLQVDQDVIRQLNHRSGVSHEQVQRWIDGLIESEFYATFLWEDLVDESGEVIALYGQGNLPLRRLDRSRMASQQGIDLLSHSFTRRQRIYYQMRRHILSTDEGPWLS